jgi:hypothetical protein
MRLYTAYVIGFALALTPFMSLSASASDSYYGGAQPAANQPAPPAQACPAGQYWEPAGYVADGKWREAHCANVDGTQ